MRDDEQRWVKKVSWVHCGLLIAMSLLISIVEILPEIQKHCVCIFEATMVFSGQNDKELMRQYITSLCSPLTFSSSSSVMRPKI